jgi:hypothetical protein
MERLLVNRVIPSQCFLSVIDISYNYDSLNTEPRTANSIHVYRPDTEVHPSTACHNVKILHRSSYPHSNVKLHHCLRNFLTTDLSDSA